MYDAPAPGPDLSDDAEAKAGAETPATGAPETAAVPAPAGPVTPAAPAVPAQARPEQRTDLLPSAASGTSTTSGAAPSGPPAASGAHPAPVLLVCGVSDRRAHV